MCSEDNKQAQNIITRIKKLLFNLDLTVVYAQGEIKLRHSTMKLYEGATSKWKQRKYVEAKVDAERLAIYQEDVERDKKEILEGIENILAKYQPRYKRVFIMYFLQDKTYQEIADETNYSLVAINKIIAKLKSDLLTFYLP